MAARIPASIDAKLLGLYLSDHLTGSTAGVSRIRRMAEAYADTPVAGELSRISQEISSEREVLRGIIKDLGLRPRRHRQAAAWLGEHAGRLKLNGRIVSRSPMTMVLEAELMRSAILGKLGGWQVLAELAPDLGVDPVTLAALADDARNQIEALTRVHEHARSNAFHLHGDLG
ncbi:MULTISPECIES: hypothetical protein [unclassified Arthrobacter]|uniref:hypothetical protein n=1 Tax=unclassified Arthrobacter TaxID=235627 RepID=UPI001CFFF4F0|nr:MULTISPECIES: hypothetical protein [unclassified Arthrobacter]MCB5281992.1 hypothetical protein [Arthrobacter sp. ES1]WGZ80330.1 hypothetical protein QI450_03675 [Arthrobacter sp. EM1]